MSTRKFYTVRELWQMFAPAIGRDRISKLVNAGHIRCVHLNGTRYVPAREVDRFYKLLTTGTAVTLRDVDGTVLVQTSGGNP